MSKKSFLEANQQVHQPMIDGRDFERCKKQFPIQFDFFKNYDLFPPRRKKGILFQKEEALLS